MIFAILEVERPPLSWQTMPANLETWVKICGGFSAVGLVIWLIVYLIRGSRAAANRWPPWQALLFWIAVAGMVVGYGIWAPLELLLQLPRSSESVRFLEPVARFCLLWGAACALAAVALPFVVDAVRFRGRRIWALARLSFKEAIRRRILWVFFVAMVLVFLFAGWFIEAKAENQVRNYVTVLYWTMTVLMLVMAGLLAAFSIPADVRDQTIHTIVTKPVERFEIAIGRFLGYALLMTLVLVVMTGISVLYVFREISPEAKEESMHARVPLYGELSFYSRKDPKFQGTNVGREWGYRSYIAGGAGSPERAIWKYQDLPPELVRWKEDMVPCEFSFDIFRTLKGEEGKGVLCSFTFQNRRWDAQHRTQYQQERQQELAKAAASAEQKNKVYNALAEKYGIFEIANKEIVDYHTQALEIPAALFTTAPSEASRRPTAGQTEESPAPALLLSVKCESGGQYVGMARADFYILDADHSFAWNFFKGAGGLWLRVLLVIGLAVTCSTYLSGVISFVLTVVLYLLGVFQDYIQKLATGALIGGGPMESFYRLMSHQNLAMPLESTPTAQLALGIDPVIRFVYRLVFALIPDVDRFDWTDYVAEGFNIGVGGMFLPSLVSLLGYLLPCALIAYYLMTSREIAS